MLFRAEVRVPSAAVESSGAVRSGGSPKRSGNGWSATRSSSLRLEEVGTRFSFSVDVNREPSQPKKGREGHYWGT